MIMCRRDLKTLLSYISNSVILNDWQTVNIVTIQELCKMRDGILCSELTSQEIELLINFICTEDIVPVL